MPITPSEFSTVDVGRRVWRSKNGHIQNGPYTKRTDSTASDMVGFLHWFDPTDEVLLLPEQEQPSE
jgi:hypothetical protein